MSSVFGLNEKNELVHVSEVSRGLACHCQCVACGEPLVARQGKIRDHHFAHSSNLEACESSFETLLHRYAKQLVAQAGGLIAPVTPKIADFMGWDDIERQRILMLAGTLEQEVNLGPIRPDLLLATSDGIQVAIEIAFSSFCDATKASTFKQMQLPALEIDVSGFSPENFDPTDLMQVVIEGTEKKVWVWPNAAYEDSTQQTPNSPYPNSQTAAAMLNASKHLPEEILNFCGRWVSVKQFPSGDIAIKVVSWDPDLVSLVKNVARSHGGRYNARYKSWNVPRWAARMVRQQLSDKARSLEIGVLHTPPRDEKGSL